MKFWLDTEFNEYRGALISMALVAEDGREWYEVLPCPNPGAWVADHVIPVLVKIALPSQAHMAKSLEAWLKQFDAVHIIADWPDDVAHFCNVLVTGPGIRIDTPPLTFEIMRGLPDTADISDMPHNALADAKALRKAALGG